MSAKKSVISWKFTLGFIVVTLLVIILAPKLTSRKNTFKDECNANNDCQENQECKYSPDFERKICIKKGTLDCSITNPLKCELNKANSCSKCLTSIPFNCISVTYGALKIVSAGTNYTDGTYSVIQGSGKDMEIAIKTDKGKIIAAKVSKPGKGYKKGDILMVENTTNGGKVQLQTQPKPYFFKQGEDVKILPESEDGFGWCLPDVQDNTCNPFTSDQILVNIDPVHNKYEWGCYCTNPDMFGQDEIFTDCNVEHACGNPNDGKLYVLSKNPKVCSKDSECGQDEKCCPPDYGSGRCSDSPASSSVKKHCYTPWTKNQLQDPRDGRCECNTGLEYFGRAQGSEYTKECLADSCVPGRREGTSCNCPKPGYIKCPEDVPLSNKKLRLMCKDDPQCIPDECAPGYWSPNDHKCICDNTKGYASVLDPSSNVGSRCVKKCLPNNSCGERGTCKVVNDEETCENCVCPYAQDPTNKCLIRESKNHKGDVCYSDNDCCAPLKCKGEWWSPLNKYCT